MNYTTQEQVEAELKVYEELAAEAYSKSGLDPAHHCLNLPHTRARLAQLGQRIKDTKNEYRAFRSACSPLLTQKVLEALEFEVEALEAYAECNPDDAESTALAVSMRMLLTLHNNVKSALKGDE